MRILIYKRTHPGDPDFSGCFGINTCMGKVRGYGFDAVIGVGGIGAKARANKLDGKVNWVGIGAHKSDFPNKQTPYVTFDNFCLLDDKGPDLRQLAPMLAKRMYTKNARFFICGPQDTEYDEAVIMLKLAKNSPSSKAIPLKRL